MKILVILLLPSLALAHAFDPAVVTARENPDGSFTVQGEARLDGRVLTVESEREALVRVIFRDGRMERALVHGESIDLAPARPRPTREFARLGVIHILTGWDHLLFLVGLVLLVRRTRALVGAVTAFTVAHSLTLAFSALGHLTLPPAPVEAAIALSIVALAVELTRDGPSLLARAPALVAFAFGLLHGLGFAGALADLGLSPEHAAVELFAFNCGVEIGQLAFLLPWILIGQRLPRRPAAYVLGSAGSALAIARVAAFFSLALLIGGCEKEPVVEKRVPCAARNPLKNLYFGDLHVHTGLSFDANMFEVRTTPADAYRFARGEPLALPPLDAQGQGTRTIKIDRPLDFAAVTDHSEFLGEVEACSTPGSDAYESNSCRTFRAGGQTGVISFGIRLGNDPPTRDDEICGADGARCKAEFATAWRRVQDAAEGAYDRTATCGFTSLIGYEYSANPSLSTLHRNVIFRSERVPDPITYFERTTPEELWRELEAACKQRIDGCDVLAIPHNSNESNGRMFLVEGGADQARLRQRMEPLVEIYQHKGDSECMNGLSGIAGAPDEACDFEKSRRTPFQECDENGGAGGTARRGCFSTRDFVRNALLEGLRASETIGVNPLRLGIIASTDTHNGTPGAVAERGFLGHRGLDDDTPELRLGAGALTPGGVEFSPGGLAAVWAEENSRPAIFDALRRRETYGTSGPRITARFFGGRDLPSDLCSRADLVELGYQKGVPMGGSLSGGPPAFVISALRDPDGAKLQRAQVVKGWVQNGELHTQVYDVAGSDNGADVDLATCTPRGDGADSLCAVWRDPAFDPTQPAYWYLRILENPTCRWTTFECNTLSGSARPAGCDDATRPKTIQERAWTSPIWFEP